jgi:nitrile hydratase accessory protein
MSAPDLAALAGLPRDAGGPIFAEPWQAQTFAMTLALYEAGQFTWPQWAAALSAQIAAAQGAGDPDTGETYWTHWLAALEAITVQSGAATAAGLADLRDAWDRAARATPHGTPLALENDPHRA